MDGSGAAGRALRPHPVLRLALSVLRLRRRGRRRGARTAGAGRRLRRGARGRARPARRRARRGVRAGRGRRSRRVYLGGGTPSLLPAETIARLLDLVRERFGIAAGAEVTLEANPGPDERGDPAALRAAGITRLSIGAQAMSAAGLRRLGRRHRVVDVVRAVAEARAAGIGSVSLDLLYDVPDASLADWIETLEAALALEPDHLSLYALTLDDPDAEGLTGPDGDHLPTTSGARRWRATARPAPGRGPRRGRVPPRRPSPGRGRLARLRDQQLGAAGPREPAQPRLLAAPAVRGRRARARTRSTA